MATPSFLIVGSVLQFVVFLLFSIYGKYSFNEDNGIDITRFEFTHLMIFVGFGFLYAFLRKYSWTGIGQNFIIGTLALEFYFVFYSFWKAFFSERFLGDYEIALDGVILLEAEFCAGSILVSYGALIGRVDTSQMLYMTLIECFVYTLNEYIVLTSIETSDLGGGITLHTFGAYFGLSAALIFKARTEENNKGLEASYYSNIYALLATLILWVSWPSFNSALVSGRTIEIVEINTIFALIGSTIATFLFSYFLNNGKLNVVSVINATLSGGVAIGTAATVISQPGSALLIGFIAGIISTYGFEKLSSILQNLIGLQDNAGIHNLHGIPGLIGAIASFFAFVVIRDDGQAAKQLYGLLATLGLASSTGFLFGFVLKSTRSVNISKLYKDEEYWIDVPYSQEMSKTVNASEISNKLIEEQKS
jgi:ammonium transporter Rh